MHTTRTSYDTEGNVLSTTDVIGNVTSYLYDKNNRRIQITDAKGGTTKTGYDTVGNIATITDSVNNTTTYGYDALDRLITDTNQLNKTRTRNYDNVGNLTQTTDRNSRKVAYSYDTLNRQTSEQWLDSNSATIKTFSASYDAVGHLITSTNPDSKYSYTYDEIDRLTSIDNTGTNGVPAVKFNYGYDAIGNLITVNDSINGTNAATTGYTYDLLNRVTKLTQTGTGVQTKRVDMAYNAVNQLTSLSRYSGVNPVVDTNYTYDNNQRLIKLAHNKGVSTIASYDYSYDDADKLASTISSVDGTSNYSYDLTNQLTGTDHTSQTDEAYSYDANGNRTSGGTVTGVNNQLLSDGTYSYQYDNEGNRTKRTEIATGKVTEYVWDYRNRLASVLFKDALGGVTKTIDYIYDGDNQRIGKRIDGVVTERYVLDRNQIALVFDGNGSQTHRYLYGTQVDQVLADETATGMVWALADRQGTVRDLVDNSGNIIEHLIYDSFGKLSNASTTGFRYGYTGREQDSETGLDYYRARYYDATNGKFISEDPIGFEGGDSNLSRYVGNNTVNLTDSSGQKVDIISQTFRRNIFYDNKTGRHYTNNINDVVVARKQDNTTSITSDITSAALYYSGPGNDNLGTGVLPALKSKIPDKLPGDQNGHIIGKQLGGSGKTLNNLVAQKGIGSNQNPNSPWRRFEDRVRNEIETEYTEIPQPLNGICPSPIQNPQKAHQTAVYSVIFRYPYAILRPDQITGAVIYYLPFMGVNTKNGVLRYPATMDGVSLNN